MGEGFRAGAKVVKNVTGFDLPKLVCGAFGTLCVLTELTFRVYPPPQPFSAALAIRDLGARRRLRARCARSALQRRWSSSGLAYLPAGNTLLPDVGSCKKAPPSSVLKAPARAAVGKGLSLAQGAAQGRYAGAKSQDGALLVLSGIRAGTIFAGNDLDVWRVFVPATEAPRVAAEIAAPLWLERSGGPAGCCGSAPGAAAKAICTRLIRALAAAADGQAMLLRASIRSHRAPRWACTRRRRPRWPRLRPRVKACLRSLDGSVQSGPASTHEKPVSPPGTAWRDPGLAPAAKQRAHLRALRHLHRHLSHLCCDRRRARRPARPHPVHAEDAGGGRHAPVAEAVQYHHRPLPVLPQLPQRLSFQRRLCPAGGQGPRPYRRALSSSAE